MKEEELRKRQLALSAISCCLRVYDFFWKELPELRDASDENLKERRRLVSLTHGLIIHDRILNSGGNK